MVNKRNSIINFIYKRRIRLVVTIVNQTAASKFISGNEFKDTLHDN